MSRDGQCTSGLRRKLALQKGKDNAGRLFVPRKVARITEVEYEQPIRLR